MNTITCNQPQPKNDMGFQLETQKSFDGLDSQIGGLDSQIGGLDEPDTPCIRLDQLVKIYIKEPPILIFYYSFVLKSQQHLNTRTNFSKIISFRKKFRGLAAFDIQPYFWLAMSLWKTMEPSFSFLICIKEFKWHVAWA